MPAWTLNLFSCSGLAGEVTILFQSYYQAGMRSAIAFKVLFKLCMEVTPPLPPHSDCGESESLPEAMFINAKNPSEEKQAHPESKYQSNHLQPAGL